MIIKNDSYYNAESELKEILRTAITEARPKLVKHILKTNLKVCDGVMIGQLKASFLTFSNNSVSNSVSNSQQNKDKIRRLLTK